MRDEQDLLSGIALTTFRLNGVVLELAEQLARPAGLTAAWWQVLGAVLPAPLPVAGIAREMGMARQSVQRIADLLVDKGFAEYVDNPAHRRAKLVRVTDDGRAAIKQINPAHARAAKQLVQVLGVDELRASLQSLERLTKAMESVVT